MGDLFGGGSKSRNTVAKYKPYNFSAPGLSGQLVPVTGGGTSGVPVNELSGYAKFLGKGGGRSFGGAEATYALTRSSQVESLVNSLTGLGSDISALRAGVRPGFGRLTESRVQAIRYGKAQALGDLRASLARRRILGSSFGEDALARTQLAYTQEEEKARAESFIQETELTSRLIGQQLDTTKEALAQYNFESNIAASLASGLSNIANQNAIAQGEAQSAASASQANVIGSLASAAIIALAA